MPNAKTKFCKVAPNVCAPSVSNWRRVTLPASVILRWLLDFWKTVALLHPPRYVHNVDGAAADN